MTESEILKFEYRLRAFFLYEVNEKILYVRMVY